MHMEVKPDGSVSLSGESEPFRAFSAIRWLSAYAEISSVELSPSLAAVKLELSGLVHQTSEIRKHEKNTDEISYTFTFEEGVFIASALRTVATLHPDPLEGEFMMEMVIGFDKSFENLDSTN
jgi:hypothetical protein